MTALANRQRDPHPLGRGWETPVAVAGAAALGIILVALLGLGVAGLLFGGGWVWPHSQTIVIHVVGGILHGHPGRGLPPGQARRLPGAALSYVCVAVAEIALISAGGTAAVWLVRWRRPGDARGGMATRAEAADALGVRNLRAAAPIIRPDLHDAHQPGPLRRAGLGAWGGGR